ncbi:vasoactive intestinal polypeptide receptor 1 isoform X7 [Moschus berezovskii]|uniref:vasoactive intestinal polypeptide receptor 1 isoform X7 n=1 Tax=Moschus berezovskii TaxID=68408 RepID=UPI002443BBD7|nr:vasoactive intestinal polypeptide receptor 1 isoform X7 [Moschus berezovskii]
MGTEDERWSQTPGLLPGLAPRTRSQGPTQNKGGREAGLQQEECDYLRLISVQHEQCLEEAQLENETAGCGKMWDNLTCWPATPRGQVVVLACPLIFKLFSPIQGRNVSRSCTEAGWTPLEPGPYPVACGLDDNSSSLDEILTPLPLAAADSVLQFCEDRLHHRLQLVPRHSPGRHGHPEPVQEAPLHTELHPYAPLHILHPEGRRRLHQRLGPLQQWGDGPLLQGLGVPSTFTLVWTIIRIHFEDYGCWDTINSSLWWIIKAPILASILVNFILFIRIIGILVQKLRPPDVGKSDSSPYSRLAKSTLLLIPLFGVHYIMFAFFPDNFKAEVKMVFELVVGSFQGFVVAILYCFLNGEVQAELRRKWRRWRLHGVLGWDPKYQHPSAGSNGATCSTQVSMLTRVSPGAGRSSSFQAEVSLV